MSEPEIGTRQILQVKRGKWQAKSLLARATLATLKPLPIKEDLPTGLSTVLAEIWLNG
jgi:hypothetical protein